MSRQGGRTATFLTRFSRRSRPVGGSFGSGALIGTSLDVGSGVIRTTGAVRAASATFDVLDARDRLACGPMVLEPGAKASSGTSVNAGSFFWRRGDRAPTTVTVIFKCASSSIEPEFTVSEPRRNTSLGSVRPGAGTANAERMATIALAGTSTVADSDDVYKITIDMCLKSGSSMYGVSLVNYSVSVG